MLVCDKCGSYNMYTSNTRNDRNSKCYVSRRRICKDCNNRYSTVEITMDEYKKNKKLCEQLKKQIEDQKKEAIKIIKGIGVNDELWAVDGVINDDDK